MAWIQRCNDLTVLYVHLTFPIERVSDEATHLCFTYLAMFAVLQFNQEFLARAHFNVGLVGQSSLNISKNEFYLLVGVVRPAER